MSINTSLKRLAACLLSAALVAVGLPAGSGGLYAKDKVLTAAAAESAVGKPLMGMDSVDIEGDLFYDADVDIINNAVVNIGKNGKSSLTINGMLNLFPSASINLYNGSYLVVNGRVYFDKNTSETCSDGSRIIMTSPELHVDRTTVCNYDDFIATSLTNLRYVPTAVTTKEYFRSGNTYYVFSGTGFDEVTDNSKTLRLKELCTLSATAGFDYKYSPAVAQAFAPALLTGELKTGIRGYTIDGETCDAMYLPAKRYTTIDAFSLAYSAFIKSGAAYIITDDETASVITVPKFYSAFVHVGDDLTLYYVFKDVTEETADDFRIVLSGRCDENGMEQSLARSGDNYVVSATLSANNLRQEISGKILYKGTEIGEGFSYSAEKYLTSLAKAKPEFKDMCEAIGFYGMAAENYFNGRNNDISALSASFSEKYGLGPEDIENTFDEMDALYNTNYKPKFTSDMAKVSLVLESTVALRLYIPTLYDGQKVGGENGFTAKTSQFGVYIEIPGMTPLGMHNIINLSNQLNLGAFTWVYRVLTDPVLSKEAKSRDLAVAVYTYSQTVYDFVHGN
jgi:hypothetical protein